MSNALTPIIAHTRVRLDERRAATPPAALGRAAHDRAAADPPRPFAAALRGPGLRVIAEHKRSSPSAGLIRAGIALEEVVGAYERGAAAALSVLTEFDSFSGSLDDLRRARAAASLPILRKDFIVDPYQVTESLAAGADAILLIVAALEPAQLGELYAQARELGLGTLVEVHDAAELELAAAVGAEVIGVNNRDLTTLRVDPERTFQLVPEIPDGTVTVSESGWRTRAELDRLDDAGVDAVLIGEALMRSPDIESACRALTGAARAA
ncbi:MAG TPA: indole-3-glycerol phosphate synthase TrpC [Solirubrobacteraceae bacterium]|jgi:indole-3-glycerol phosphate synthase|nr:indole-3-glycerol phosphate synthase TrpC [Solirubrobacteraceae bacterium]